MNSAEDERTGLVVVVCWKWDPPERFVFENKPGVPSVTLWLEDGKKAELLDGEDDLG